MIPLPFSSGPSRDSVTILLITPTRLVRADFDGKREPLLRQIWEARAPSGETLPVLVEAAFMLGAPRKASVYVLAAGLSTQVLQVPAGKVAGLEGEELSNALSFEAEAISGINPFDSALAAVPAGGSGTDRSFWVTQMSQADLAQIQESLHQRKAFLKGVAHPGGLLRALGHATSGWQRVELWNDIVLCVDGSAPQSPRAHVVGTAPSRGMWRPQVDQWFGAQVSDRAVMVADSSLIQYADGPTVSLDEEMVLKSWLQEWATDLTGERSRMPLVRPAPKPMPDAQRVALAASLALAAGAICVGHFFFMQHRDRVLRRELMEAEAPSKRLAEHTAAANSLQGQLEQVRREAQELRELREFWKDTLDKEHRRHATLLLTLAQATPPDLAIITIDEYSGELHLTGLSMTPDVPGFATNVASAVEPFGWRIEPPRRRALNLAADGGPWQLDWSLRTVIQNPGVAGPAPTNSAPTASAEAIRAAAGAASAAAAATVAGEGVSGR
jgi:hypothetical protein